MDIRAGALLGGPSGRRVAVESLLGRGGFGQVFKGALDDGTAVAVKTVLTAALDDAELAVLQNEAKHALEVEHPHVVRVLHVSDGSGDDGTPPYIVMEFVGGGTLRSRLDERAAAKTLLDVEELRAIWIQIAEAMKAINARLVHRDLKPENVLVADDGTLKVADFGLAKLADAATRSETFKGWGTRAYQAPEAFDGTANTPAMDMYAAGVLFFETATFERPIVPVGMPADYAAWRRAHLLESPKNLQTFRRDLPPPLVQLVERMLQKNPMRRPASWDEVLRVVTRPPADAKGPDVSALVHKATATLRAETEAQARAKESRQKQEERAALIDQAFREPISTLQLLVDAYNAESGVSPLTFRQTGPRTAEVATSGRPPRKLLLTGVDGNDVPMGINAPHGFARALVIIQIQPRLVAKDTTEERDQSTIGSFNLVYRVAQPTAMFGDWQQLKFEVSPLTGRGTFPHWFGIDLAQLPRELEVLNAMGMFQHQKEPLNDAWFKELLVHLL